MAKLHELLTLPSVAEIEEAAKAGKLLDLEFNGKKLGDMTGEEVRQMGELYNRLAALLQKLEK